MPDALNGQHPASGSASAGLDADTDAIVIGAGIGGLRMLHELREQGLSARVFEAAPDLGGTWYWNTYPGARTDSESWVYAYSFSKELQDEWTWSERYPTQAEVHRYLSFVADRLDLRRDITFGMKVDAAEYDEASACWLVTTADGHSYRCRYLVSAIGLLSTPYTPDIAGIEDFTGDWYVTGRWPKDKKVDFTGKRVAIIGTGATGVQMIPLVSQAAAHLDVFQRTPNFVIPARNYNVTDYEMQAIRASYDEIWRKARRHPAVPVHRPAGITKDDVTPEQHQQVLEGGWEVGGFRYMYATFDDISLDEEANAIASEFVRNKIRAIVKNPATAELLCPKDHPIGSKRPPLGHFYYEAFNRHNVRLVDISSTPITRITPAGVQVGDEEYPCDILVFATGFDAATGSYGHLDIRSCGELTLEKKWADGPRTHLGITVDGFPNLFLISGPQSPFGNIPVVVDATVEWIGQAIGYMRSNGFAAIEPNPEAVDAWWQTLQDYVNATVLTQGTRSWFLGANIPGKPQGVLFFFGGVGTYRKTIAAAAAGGYRDFAFSTL